MIWRSVKIYELNGQDIGKFAYLQSYQQTNYKFITLQFRIYCILAITRLGYLRLLIKIEHLF